MNRKIKFRVWDEEVNSIEYPYKIDTNTGFAYYYDGKGDHARAPIKNLIQFTGLLDRNGKEIYEGDILGGTWEHHKIDYCNACKAFQMFALGDYGCLACDGDMVWLEVLDSESKGELEVIGNIYENPELLEAK